MTKTQSILYAIYEKLKGFISHIETDKQDKLIPGEGIIISEDGKTISISPDIGSGGSSSLSGNSIVILSLDEFNELSSPLTNVDYIITENPATLPIPPNNEVWYTTNDELAISLDDYAFGDNNRIESNVYSDGKGIITLQDPVMEVSSTSFPYLESLISVTFPDSLAFINEMAFSECYNLETVIANGLSYIGDNAFNCCYKLRSITIPSTVEYIGVNTFQSCSELSSNIIIPDGITIIPTGAFGYCDLLSSVTLPTSIINIEYGAFSGCANLVITYKGTIALWNGISKGEYSIPSSCVIKCTDGDINN